MSLAIEESMAHWAPVRMWEAVVDAVRQLPVMLFSTDMQGRCTMQIGGVLSDVGLAEGAGVGLDVRNLPGLAEVWMEAREVLTARNAPAYRTTIAPGMEPGGAPAGSTRWAGQWVWVWTVLRHPWSARPIGLVCLALRLGDAVEESRRETLRGNHASARD